MYCQKCGKEIDNEAVVCVHCGCSTENQPTKQVKTKELFYYENFLELIKSLIITGVSLYGVCVLLMEYIKYRDVYGKFNHVLSEWFIIFIFGLAGVIKVIIKNKNRK